MIMSWVFMGWGMWPGRGRDPGLQAPAINIGDNGPVSQESREQDKYFENQATKTNVTNLVAAREIHSVEIFVFHSYTNRQRVNECAELPFVLQYYIFDLWLIQTKS